MNSGITDLSAFLNKRATPAALSPALDELGVKNMRVIASNLISWLKRQHRFGHERGLELEPQQTWCQELPRLLVICGPLGELFKIEAGVVDFRDDVPKEARVRIRQFVAREDQPVLISHPRRTKRTKGDRFA